MWLPPGASTGYWDPTGEKNRQANVDMLCAYFIDRLLPMFELDGLPEYCNENWIKRLILTTGAPVVGVVDGKLWWTYAAYGGERNGYYIPTTAIISNPYIPWYDEIDINDPRIVVWENDTMRLGLLPLLRRYASALTDNQITLRQIDINARCPAIVSAQNGDTNTKESAKAFFHDLELGKIGIVARRALAESLASTPYADAGKTSIKDAIEYEQYLIARLWNEIGLQANYSMKREAINESEAGMNLNSLLPFVDHMFTCWTKAAEKVSEQFGEYLPNGTLTVRKGSAWADVQEDADAVDEIGDQNLTEGGDGDDAAGTVPDVGGNE